MKTNSIQAGGRLPYERTGSTQLCGNGSTLVRTLLVFGPVLVGLSAFAALSAEPTYKLFGRQVGGYSSKDDAPAIVQRELGAKAKIVDWQEIKQQFGQSESALTAFCEKTGLKPNASACVTLDGKRFWQNERQYFIYRADHKMPEDFLVHDQLQNNQLLLGSWIDARPILVRINEFTASDAAKWAKWDSLLKDSDATDILGLYSLVSVDGKAVPASISHEGHTLQIRSGSFTITPEGRCISKITLVPPGGAETSVEVTATYRREGPQIRMQWRGAGTTTGKVQGDLFTMQNEGMAFVYRK